MRNISSSEIDIICGGTSRSGNDQRDIYCTHVGDDYDSRGNPTAVYNCDVYGPTGEWFYSYINFFDDTNYR